MSSRRERELLIPKEPNSTSGNRLGVGVTLDLSCSGGTKTLDTPLTPVEVSDPPLYLDVDFRFVLYLSAFDNRDPVAKCQERHRVSVHPLLKFYL